MFRSSDELHDLEWDLSGTLQASFSYMTESEIRSHLNAAINRGKDMISRLEKVVPPDYTGLFEAYEEAAAAVSHFYQLFPFVVHDEDTKRAIADLRKVDIDYSSGVLKLSLHPLLPVPSKGGYNNYHDVFESLSAYLKENDLSFDLEERYVIIYERIVKGDVYLRYGVSDNDNIETRRITNAIVDAVGVQDSADKLMFLYRTEPGDDYRMNVYFAPQDIVYTILPF